MKGRKILLLVDNCSAHSNVLLNQITWVFMPPNTSLKLQVMEQGLIYSLKIIKIMLIKIGEAFDIGDFSSHY